MTTSGYVWPLIVQELLEERFGPLPTIVWREREQLEQLTREQQRRRRVLLGLEDQNGAE